MAIRDERPPILTFSELLDQVTNARYASQTKVGPELARSAVANMISPDEIGKIHAAALARRAELMGTEGEPASDELDAVDTMPTDLDTLAPRAWSPSGILDRLPHVPEGPDHMERQLPVGDRDDR
jgi:hypothetical protein